MTYGNMIGNGIEGRYEAGSGKYYYYIKDHLGSTRLVLRNDNVVIEANDYYPLGLKMPGRSYLNSAQPTKEGFTGKEQDAETNLQYFGARYYDPAIGRFLSVDPHNNNTTDWTPYRYGYNNPLQFVDPTGTDEIERQKALEKAKEYIEKNPNKDPKLYDPNGKGNPGAKGGPGKATDCSGLVSNSIIPSGVEDPAAKGTGGGVERTVANTEAVNNNDVQEGNIATFNNGRTGKAAKAHVHEGIVTKVNREKGQVISVKIIQSGSSTGPVESIVKLNGKGYWGKRFEGFRKWDSPEPKTK